MISTVVPSSRRDWTREHIYQTIKASTGLTRSALVERTGLPTSTVGHAVAGLLDEGRITSVKRTKGPGTGSGRPARLLLVASRGLQSAAIDFGHSHIRVAVGDDLGSIVDETTTRFDVNQHADESIAVACEEIERLAARHGLQPTAVAAGIPGPLDRTTGKVESPTILPSWVGRRPAADLEARLGIPVTIENDAVLGAYGELRQGAGRGLRHFLYINASHGLAAGIVLNGQTYHGAIGLAGAIGHTMLHGRTQRCRCGTRGCPEAAISVDSLLDQIGNSSPHLHPGDIGLTTAGPTSSRILNEAGQALGEVLAEACNLLNPSAVIIGGELGCAGQPVIDGVRLSIDRHAQPAIAQCIDVMPAALGRRAELIGALELARSMVA